MKTKLLEPVEGFDISKYDYRKGINPSGEDVLSNLVVESVMNLILDGYSDNTIYAAIGNTYGTSSWATKFILNKAHQELNRKMETQEENILHKQNSRLFKLYRQALGKGDEKTALQVLAEINRLNSLYTKKIEVTSDVFTLDLGIGGTSKEKNEDSEQED